MPCNVECLRTHGCLDPGTRKGYPYSQCALQEMPPFSDVPMYYPEYSQRSPKPQGRLYAALALHRLFNPSLL